MRARISVIIPTLNAAETLPNCLVSLDEGLEQGLICEVIVSDGGSTDATNLIADGAGSKWITGSAGRGGQLRRGAEVAKGEWLLFLHADSCLLPGWTWAVSTHLQHSHAGYFHLRFDITGVMSRWVAGWANLRSRVFDLPYGDQGLLISRRLYDQIDGYPDIPLMEDVAIARRLKGQLKPVQTTITTSARRYQNMGWVRCGARNLSYLIRYLMGANPAKLAQGYNAANDRSTSSGS